MFRIHALLVLFVSLVPSLVLANGVTAPQGSEGLVEMRDVPLVDVLEAIAALDGREIVVKGDIQGHRVSVVLQHGKVQSNLKRALHGLNYALAWGPDNTLRVWVCAAGVEASPASDANIVIQSEPVISPPASLFPDAPLVVPSSEDGKRGYTEADIAQYRSEQIPLDPALLAVVPAGKQGRGTVTRIEIRQITESEPPLGPQALVLPAAVPGGKGTTLEELELMRAHNNEALDLSRRDSVVPPE